MSRPLEHLACRKPIANSASQRHPRVDFAAIPCVPLLGDSMPCEGLTAGLVLLNMPGVPICSTLPIAGPIEHRGWSIASSDPSPQCAVRGAMASTGNVQKRGGCSDLHVRRMRIEVGGSQS